MKTFKKKILLIGPFNENGGRELEASFIHDSLKCKYDVILASTEILSNNNLIYKLTRSKKIYSKLRRIGIKFKIINLIYGSKIWFRLNRDFRFVSFEELISKNDIVFILAQMISPNVSKIINIAIAEEKKIIFRTTGTNPILNLNFLSLDKLDLLKSVHVYVHHSEANFNRLKKSFEHNYEIIDQTVFFENKIDKPKIIDRVKQFYCASRIDDNKNLELVINVFNELKNFDVKLHVYGDGERLEQIKLLSNSENILFHGYFENQDLIAELSNHDCLIISSFEESGPYTALEAMACSNLILSTNVGAMNERLKNAPYDWQFDANSEESLKLRILELIDYDKEMINIIQNYLRDRYFSSYSSRKIKNKYLEIIEKYC